MRIDARLPVRFGTLADLRDGDAVLLPAGTPPPPGVPAIAMAPGTAGLPGIHPVNCACCAPRNAAALALGDLFLRRARGEVAPFRSVLAVVERADAALVHDALASDLLVSGRFRAA